jgi:hypothetical protein
VLMNDSPIDQLLEATDRLDVDAVTALLAPDVRFMSADGRRAEGRDAARKIVSEFFATLRATTHRITEQWHVDDVCIAEVDASYELQDWLQLNDLPRAFFVRMGSDGIADVRVYGAHERPLTDHRTGEEGMWVGSRWVPPL